MFGRPEEEVLRSAQRWLPFIHEEDVPKVLSAWSTVKHGTQLAFDIEYRIKRPDGSQRLIRDRGLVDSVHGQVIGALNDVTQRLPQKRD